MNKLILAVIVFSIFLRFYKLGQIPNGLASDEADLGYNSYSIIKTGADIYGQKFPLFFQSLDDYKPGLVFYLTIPPILIFGLNDFAIRLAPAIFGSLSILLVFLFTKLLYSQKSSAYPKNQLLPYIAASLLSLAPWHLSLSRAMIWYSLTIFLYLVFFTAFLFAQKKYLKTKYKLTLLIMSSFCLAMSLYVYYASIIYLPLILITLALLYKDFLIKNMKNLSIPLIIFLALSLPAFIHYMSAESKTRLNAISVLTADVTLPISLTEIEKDREHGLPFSNIIHNRRLVYASSLLDNYLDYFNLDYLFVGSHNIRYFYVNNVGLFHFIELPFVLYGLYLLLKRRERSDKLILALLLIGPIPAMITLGSPFPHRSLTAILALQLISAIGIGAIISSIFLRSKRVQKIALLSFFVAFAMSFYFFTHQYFVHSKDEFTTEFTNGAWFSTVRDAIPKLNHEKQNYENVVFSWSQQRLVPGIYYALYNKVDPVSFQSKAAGWTNEPPSYRQIYNQIENIEFRPINWEQDRFTKNSLLVGYPPEFPSDVKDVVNQTYSPNGQPHFLFVSPN